MNIGADMRAGGVARGWMYARSEALTPHSIRAPWTVSDGKGDWAALLSVQVRTE